MHSPGSALALEPQRRTLARWFSDESAVITWLAALLFLGASALTAWIVVSDYRETRASAEASLVNLVDALQRNIARNIQVYDLAIQETAAASRLPDIADVSPEWRRAALFSHVATTEFSSTLFVLDASGNLRFDSSQDRAQAANFADRAYFRIPRDQPGIGLYIDSPIRTRVTNKNVITFSRRITDPDGNFAGVVGSSVEVSYLTNLLASLELGEGGSVNLIRADGILLARYPEVANLVGASIGSGEPFRFMLKHRDGIISAKSSIDQVTRIYAFRTIGSLPLVVAVSYGRDSVFSAWRAKTVLTVAAIASLIGLGAVLIGALRRQLNRRSIAERRALDSVEQARRSESNLAIALDRIDAVFRHSADAQFAATRRSDGQFGFDLVNRRCEELTELVAADIVGKSPAECLPPEIATVVEQHWQACVAKGEPLCYQRSRLVSTGLREWQTLLVPVRDIHGVIYRLIGTIRDVTDQKRAEEEMLRHNLTLERRAADAAAAQDDALARASVAERLQILGQLVSGVAHDFNNVLQSVTGCASIIERRADEPNTMRHAARLIADAAARGASITQRLLAFSRADPGSAERITVSTMLADVADILRHTLRGAGHIEILTQIDDEALSVDAELNQLKTVLLNLSTNARDAMPNGGRLVIGAAADTVAPGHPTLAPGDYVRLWVQDSGFGMDDATVARATEPFFTTKPVGQGTGLGLSMARTYAEEAGGALEIASRPGHGTTVSLWLGR